MRGTVILALILISSGALSGQSNMPEGNSTSLAPVTAITLPSPFPSYPDLAGQSGFFWTRSATESATLALASIPIKDKEISDLKALGEKQSIKLDAQAQTINNLVGITIVAVLATFVADEVYHATAK